MPSKTTTIKLQVPMSKKVRDAAVARAADDGLTSLQDVVRILLKKYADGQLQFFVESFPKESIDEYQNASEILADLKQTRRK